VKRTPARRRDVFLRQAEACDGRSPLYAALCRGLADDPRVDALLPDLRWDVPLRLLGGLHALVLEGRASWDDVGAALERDGDFLGRFAAEQRVQTNEAQRCWALLPAFLSLADERPLDLLELGPSAGLNLYWDRYRYAYRTGSWGPAEAPLELSGDDRRPPPRALFARRVEVVRRRGIDLEPVDVTTAEGARLLEAFVWPDQAERRERLRLAIDVVRADPPELVRGDYVDELPRLLADRLPGTQLVVFQTASTQYLTGPELVRLREALHHAGRVEPFCTVGSGRAPEDDGYALEVERWPGGQRERLGVFDYHGAWLDWGR